MAYTVRRLPLCYSLQPFKYQLNKYGKEVAEKTKDEGTNILGYLAFIPHCAVQCFFSLSN